MSQGMPSKKSHTKFCSAAHCSNNSRRNPHLTFFSLPEDGERRRRWLRAISRTDLLQRTPLKVKSYLVCSKHFEHSSIKIMKLLKKDAVPTLNLDKEGESSSSETEYNNTAEQQPMLINDRLYFNVETQTEACQSSGAPQTSAQGSGARTRKRKLHREVAQTTEHHSRNKVYHIVHQDD